jgi:hypothetical protein
MPTIQAKESSAETEILSRVLLNGRQGLTPQLARYFLARGFSDEDKTRMHELAVKNQQGTIAPDELRELDSYVRVGDLLAILQSKARKVLKAKSK